MKIKSLQENDFTKLIRFTFVSAMLISFILTMISGFSPAMAQGILLSDIDDGKAIGLPRPFHHDPVPHPPPHPRPRPQPIHQIYRIASLEVDAVVRDGVLQVTLNQSFENRGSQVSEVSAVIPLPYDATVSGMTFLVDGKEIPGNLLNVNEARRIYESYVRRSQDPALVQWIGTGMLKTNVFPIPPGASRMVTIQYSQVAPYRDGQLDLRLPLAAAGFTSDSIGKVKLSVRIKSDKKLGNIYSPTHSVKMERSPSGDASVVFESTNYLPKGDFRLLIEDRKSDVSASLLSYRPKSSEDGYFLLMLHPDFPPTKQEDTAKNIVLVLDKSGSMRGEKMEQARNALLYVLKNLSSKDRFSVIVYDGQVQSFKDELVEANDTNRESAMAFVRQLEASGSTNIDLALETAFRAVAGSEHPSYIVFLSDGEPTVGVKDPRQIVANATSSNKNRARVLSFGVGHDVNSRLLDQLSRDCFGQTFLVAPQEDVEEAVSNLYLRIGQAALADIHWRALLKDGSTFDGFRQIYPSRLQDLFSGDQITLLGRYQKSFDGSLNIEGKLGSQSLQFTSAAKLEESTGNEHSYIAALWATRRVAAIIDEIDLEGSRENLIQELVELSKRYGIITPYTAFLAEEPTSNIRPEAVLEMTRNNLQRLEKQSGADAFAQRSLKSMQGRASNLSAAADSQIAAGLGSSSPADGKFGGGGGRNAGAALPAPGIGGGLSGEVKSNSNRQSNAASNVRQSGDRAFFWRDEKWVDSTATADQLKSIEVVERFSEKYFQLIEKHRDILQPLLDEEAPLQIVLDNQAYEL
jgi:Ca-activated chloride channel family protein